MKYITNSDIETKDLAAEIARKIKGGVVTLNGSLGVGKTTFVQGFARGLGIKDKIISPTFVLIRQHPIPKSKQMLFHIDLYRLEKIDNLNTIGLKDIIADKNNFVLIEWAEKISHLLTDEVIKIDITKVDQHKREITISGLPS